METNARSNAGLDNADELLSAELWRALTGP